ncbi:putative long-chain-alcohol O-fatty-acyltransferase [Helianthus annuus]|nr:putative long-chain-alcohol O-fatty-acyltransferase [Helianthus annuus]
MELKQEMSNLIKVSLYACISIVYCFFIGKIVPKGVPRLLTFLPVIIFFLSLPLSLTSVHFIGAVSFFLSWLANFKLILFAFEKGPLSSPSIPPLSFLAMACFPIEITQSNKAFSTPKKPNNKVLGFATKGILLALFLTTYHNHHETMNPKLAWVFFGFSVYLMLELLVTLSSTLVKIFLRVELDPQFDQPYLATSLQDFWGRRWNVMVNRILHPAIYDPVLKLSNRVMSRLWAPIPAILTTFAVSGLMHELIFFYFTRAWPTWDMMLFFCLHGVCLVLEVLIKKVVNVKWRLPQPLTAPLIVAFVLATSYWLFLPELARCRMMERAFEEYEAVSELAKDTLRAITINLSERSTFTLS